MIRVFQCPDRVFLGLLAAYFGLHVALRSMVSDSLRLDEAEQVLLTQDLRWGYGAHPPLYTWLQSLVFAVAGVNAFSLALLKNALLFLTYWLTCLTAKEIFGRRELARLTTLSLLLIPLLVWESQRDQTHLILATASAAGTWFVMIRLLETRRAIWYLGLGLVAGVGVLSKYNYAILLVAMLLAGFTLPALRSAVLNRQMGLAAVGFLAVAGPHLVWAAMNPDWILAGAQRYQADVGSDRFTTALVGSLKFLRAVLAFAGFPTGVFVVGMLLSRRADKPPRLGSDHLDLIARTLGIGLVLSLTLVLAFQTTSPKGRWLQPLLIALPVLLVGWTQSRITPGGMKAVAWLGSVGAAAVVLGLYGVAFAPKWIGRSNTLNAPYAALANELRRDGFHRGTIVANNKTVGGNLKAAFQDSIVIVPGVPTRPRPRGTTLVVWDSVEEGDALAAFFEFAEVKCGIKLKGVEPRFVVAPYKHSEAREKRLGYIHVPKQSLVFVGSERE